MVLVVVVFLDLGGQDGCELVFDAEQLATDARGVFNQTVRVAGQELTVEGRVIDGVVRVGTAYR